LEPFLIQQLRLNQHQIAICDLIYKRRWFKHRKFDEPFEIKAHNPCSLESEDRKIILAQEEIRSQIVKKEITLVEATKKRSNFSATELAASLQAGKTNKTFWQYNNKNRSPLLPTLVGGVNGGSEIVEMCKDYFNGISNSDNSANDSAKFVEYSIDCKEMYLGTEMPTCSVLSLTSLLQKLPLNKTPGLDFNSAERLLYESESLFFFSVYCLICASFTVLHRFLCKHNNSSHMQKQEWEYDGHIKLQTCGSCYSGVKAT